ncbi:MAG: PilZ domain-containing protein [Myxococcales bacterium]|nr:PilZ domain-containing protein [Myxococcales bacterium]
MKPTLVRAQQRRSPRRALRLDCQVVRERDFRLLATRGLDLSAHGVLVAAVTRVLTGEPVLLTFRFPHTGWWFDAEATVARVVHGRRPRDRGLLLGLEFESIDPGVRYTLRTLLEGVPPPVPARAPRIDYAASIRLASVS